MVRKIPSLSLVILLILAFGLRLPLLNGSFWLDEAAQALESVRPFSQQLDIANDFQPPLMHLLLHFATYLGTTEWWLRLWGALIPGMLTIFFVWKIGTKHFSAKAGLLAGILLATSSLHVFYSQELRPYALPALIAVLGWWLVLRKKSEREKTWGAKLGLVTALGLYSSYLYPFAALGQFAFLIWKKTEWRSLLTAFTITTLLCLPWLPFFLEQLRIGEELREALPGWESVVSTPQIQAIAMIGAKFIFGILPVDVLNWHTAVALILITLTLHIWWRVYHKPEVRAATTLFIFWVVVPIFAAWLVSFLVPVLQPKRVLFSLPGLYLFLATLITHRSVQKKVALVLASILLFLNLFGLYQYYTQPNLQREDWRRLHQTITTDFPVDSVVIMAFPEAFAPWVWYNRNDFPTLASGTIYLHDKAQIEPVIKQAYDNYNHVIVFEYLQDLTDPDRLINQTIIEFGYKESTLYDGGPIGFVRVYSQPSSVLSYY